MTFRYTAHGRLFRLKVIEPKVRKPNYRPWAVFRKDPVIVYIVIMMNVPGLNAVMFCLAQSYMWTIDKVYNRPGRPTRAEMMSKAPAFFINGEVLLEYPRPLPFGSHYLRDLHSSSKLAIETPLDPNWETFVNSGKKGVIIFSLGSLANTTYMPEDMIVCVCHYMCWLISICCGRFSFSLACWKLSHSFLIIPLFGEWNEMSQVFLPIRIMEQIPQINFYVRYSFHSGSCFCFSKL